MNTQPTRRQLIAFAKTWPDHAGCNWKTTKTKDIIKLIRDALKTYNITRANS